MSIFGFITRFLQRLSAPDPMTEQVKTASDALLPVYPYDARRYDTFALTHKDVHCIMQYQASDGAMFVPLFESEEDAELYTRERNILYWLPKGVDDRRIPALTVVLHRDETAPDGWRPEIKD